MSFDKKDNRHKVYLGKHESQDRAENWTIVQPPLYRSCVNDCLDGGPDSCTQASNEWELNGEIDAVASGTATKINALYGKIPEKGAQLQRLGETAVAAVANVIGKDSQNEKIE